MVFGVDISKLVKNSIDCFLECQVAHLTIQTTRSREHFRFNHQCNLLTGSQSRLIAFFVTEGLVRRTISIGGTKQVKQVFLSSTTRYIVAREITKQTSVGLFGNEFLQESVDIALINVQFIEVANGRRSSSDFRFQVVIVLDEGFTNTISQTCFRASRRIQGEIQFTSTVQAGDYSTIASRRLFGFNRNAERIRMGIVVRIDVQGSSIFSSRSPDRQTYQVTPSTRRRHSKVQQRYTFGFLTIRTYITHYVLFCTFTELEDRYSLTVNLLFYVGNRRNHEAVVYTRGFYTSGNNLTALTEFEAALAVAFCDFDFGFVVFDRQTQGGQFVGFLWYDAFSNHGTSVLQNTL